MGAFIGGACFGGLFCIISFAFGFIAGGQNNDSD